LARRYSSIWVMEAGVEVRDQVTVAVVSAVVGRDVVTLAVAVETVVELETVVVVWRVVVVVVMTSRGSVVLEEVV
jgi:hypothetical protein